MVWNDAGETPNVHFVYYDTGIVPVLFDLSNLPAKPGVRAARHYRGTRSGYVIQFENGHYAGGRGGGAAYEGKGEKGERIESFRGDGGGGHAKNFIEAVRKRDPKILNAEIEQTHYSTTWCNLGNIAYRLGEPYSKDKALEIAKGYKPWQELLEGFEAHRAASGVDLKKSDIKVSSVLEIDPAKATFTGPSATPKALALLTRQYRKPFVVPEKV